MAGISAHGTTFSFSGQTFHVTSVAVDYGQERQRVSSAHMGLGANDREPFVRMHRTEDNLPIVSIEYITGSIPAVGDTGTLSLTGRLSYSGGATVVTSVVAGRVGDLVRGSASFRVV